MKRLNNGSAKRDRDVTSTVVPNKQKADPTARMIRKVAKAGTAQLQKWAKRQIKAHDRMLLQARRWKEELPEDSPLTLNDYPDLGTLLAAKACLEAIGNELASRSNNAQANAIMSAAVQARTEITPAT